MSSQVFHCAPNDPQVITSVRLERAESLPHETLYVYNRNGLAGTLVVTTGDGERIARRLLRPEPKPVFLDVETDYRGTALQVERAKAQAEQAGRPILMAQQPVKVYDAAQVRMSIGGVEVPDTIIGDITIGADPGSDEREGPDANPDRYAWACSCCDAIEAYERYFSAGFEEGDEADDCSQCDPGIQKLFRIDDIAGVAEWRRGGKVRDVGEAEEEGDAEEDGDGEES